MREGKGKQYGYPAKDERDGGSRDSDTACGTFGAVGGGCVSAGACAVMALRYFQGCRRPGGSGYVDGCVRCVDV